MEPAEPADRRRRGLNSQRKPPLRSVGLGVEEGSQLTRGRVFIVSAKNKNESCMNKRQRQKKGCERIWGQVFFDAEIVFVVLFLAKFEAKFVLISNFCSCKCPAAA